MPHIPSNDDFIGQFSLQQWETKWEPLPDAFSKPHPELRGVIGLLRMKLNGKIMYFVRATETVGGIAKGLRRLTGPNQTGNQSFGAQKIREHKSELEVHVLRVDNVPDRAEVAAKLKKAMNQLHDPEWNWPHARRLKGLRAGNGAKR